MVETAALDPEPLNPADWTTFVTTFGLTQYGGSLTTTHPGCADPGVPSASSASVAELALDVALVAGMAPGAAIQTATCLPTAGTDAIVAGACSGKIGTEVNRISCAKDRGVRGDHKIGASCYINRGVRRAAQNTP